VNASCHTYECFVFDSPLLSREAAAAALPSESFDLKTSLYSIRGSGLRVSFMGMHWSLSDESSHLSREDVRSWSLFIGRT